MRGGAGGWRSSSIVLRHPARLDRPGSLCSLLLFYTAVMKKTAAHQPEHLDMAAFARERGRLEGQHPVTGMARLSEGLHPPADAPASQVQWSAEGLWSQPLGDRPQLRLRLRARTTVWLTCQRCLQPVPLPLEIDRTVRFAKDEDEAARLDEEEDEEDVLALTRSLDLPALLEDELILALPIVPQHETCPQALPWSAEPSVPPGGTSDADAPAHPFAVLKQFSRKE